MKSGQKIWAGMLFVDQERPAAIKAVTAAKAFAKNLREYFKADDAANLGRFKNILRKFKNISKQMMRKNISKQMMQQSLEDLGGKLASLQDTLA